MREALISDFDIALRIIIKLKQGILLWNNNLKMLIEQVWLFYLKILLAK
jgi:hypothetical protein